MMDTTILVILFASLISGVDLNKIIGGKMVTHALHLGIRIGDKPSGTLAFGLFGQDDADIVDHFMNCAFHRNRGRGYMETIIHRVVEGYYLQGGVVTRGDKKTPTCDENSLLGGPLENTKFQSRTIKAAYLGMLTHDVDDDRCQFFITYTPKPWLDDNHVVIGKLIDGLKAIRSIDKVEIDDEDRPEIDIFIYASGKIQVANPFPVNTRAEDDEL